MKCPKCGYVSFDHNTACPKCNKDISEERNRLNLPDFEPAVPFLLGALTGEADEAGMDIDIAAPEVAPPVEEEEIPLLEEEEEEEVAALDEDLEISLDDDWSPEAMDEESVVADELSDFESPGEEVSLEPEEDEDLGLDLEEEEDLGLDLEDVEEPVAGEEELDLSAVEAGVGEDEEISLDLEDLSPEVATPEGPALEDESGLGTEEDLELDLEDLSTEAGVPQEPVAEAAPAAGADSDLGLDLEELSLDDDELTEDITTEDTSPTEEEAGPEFDLDSIALDEEEGALETPALEAQDDEVVLNLDDLKVNETGELEIGPEVMEAARQEAESAEDDEETTIDLDEIALDEPTGELEPAEAGQASLESDDFTMSLEDLSLEDGAETGGEDEEELSLDLDDLELDLDLEEEPKESS